MYYAIIHSQPDEVDVGKSYPFDWVYIMVLHTHTRTRV